MNEKKYFLVVDTETCNSVEQPIPYDIGYVICDKKGNIYEERSFVVAEMFLDNKDLVASAYFAEKIPQYWEEIKSGKRVLKSILNIRKQIFKDMKKYNIKEVGAYNMGFDKRALNNGIRYCTKSKIRWFFPYGTEYFCIWNMACQVILNSKRYITFARKNNLISDKGNILTSAECTYKYIKYQKDFVEEHTGLEDVKIEVDIMAKCYSKHKKMNRKINSACWRIPQHLKKTIELGETFN